MGGQAISLRPSGTECNAKAKKAHRLETAGCGWRNRLALRLGCLRPDAYQIVLQYRTYQQTVLVRENFSVNGH